MRESWRIQQRARRAPMARAVENLETRNLLAGIEWQSAITGTVSALMGSEGDAVANRVPAVTLSLFRDDNSNGQLDATEVRVRDVQTDSQGRFDFGALDPDRDYLVEIPGQTIGDTRYAEQLIPVAGLLAFELVIDRFEDAQMAIADLDENRVVTSSLVVPDGEILGGERDLLARGDTRIVVEEEAGLLQYGRGASVLAASEQRVVWDGVDGDGRTTATDLLAVDLTFDNRDALLVRAGTLEDDHRVVLQLWEGDRQANVTLDVPTVDVAGDVDSVVVRFDEFGNRVNLQRVSAIELSIDVPDNSSGVIDSIGVVRSRTLDVQLEIVPPPNRAPITVDDFYVSTDVVPLSISREGGVLANDSDPEGGLLRVVDVVVAPTLGEVSVLPDGSFSYAPTSAGTDRFEYIAADEEGATATGTVTLVIQSPNQPPVAEDDSYRVGSFGPLEVMAGQGVLRNDLEPDGEGLRVTRVVRGPELGVLDLRGDGGFTYQAVENGVDTFVYELADDSGFVATGEVEITVEAVVTTAPIAREDQYQVVEATSLFVRSASGVLANDDGDELVARVAAAPRFGELQLNDDGAFQYIPARGFIGTDDFTYRASDQQGQVSIAVVSIEVVPDGLAPYLIGDAIDVMTGERLAGAALQLYRDDGDRRFDVATDELLFETRSDSSAGFGFSKLDLDAIYFVVQPAQVIGQSQVERRVSAPAIVYESGPRIDRLSAAQSIRVLDGESTAIAVKQSRTVIGGSREIAIQRDGTQGETRVDVGRGTHGLVFSNASAGPAIATLRWPRIIGDVGEVPPRTVDLTHGGANTGFAIDVSSGDLGGLATIRLRDSSGMTSSIDVPIVPDVVADGTRFVPFSSLSGAASLDDVTLVELEMQAAARGEVLLQRFGVSGPRTVQFVDSGERPDVSVSFTVPDGPVVAGQPIEFQLVVDNRSALELRDVDVDFQPPESLFDVTFSADRSVIDPESMELVLPTGASATGTRAIHDRVSLPPGGRVVYNILGRIDPALMDDLNMEAFVATAPGQVNHATGDDFAAVRLPVAQLADLDVSKSNGRETVTVGDIVTYEIIVTNNGPSDARGVSVLDVAPASLLDVEYEVIEADSIGRTGPTTGIGNLQDNELVIPAGRRIVYQMRGRIGDGVGSVLANTVEVQPGVSFVDPRPGNNLDTDSDQVDRVVDISISIDAVPSVSVPGETLEYVVTIRNDGETTVRDVRIVDDLLRDLGGVSPVSDLIFSSSASAGVIGNSEQGSGEVTDRLTLSPAADVTYRMIADLRSGISGSIDGGVRLVLPDGTRDLRGDDNEVGFIVALQPTADLGVTIDDESMTLVAGDPLVFQIVVKNQGPSDSGEIRVEYEPPPEFTTLQFVASGTPGSTGFTQRGVGGLQDRVALPVGGEIVYSYTAQLSPDAVAERLVSSVRLTPAAGVVDPSPTNNQAENRYDVQLLARSRIQGRVFLDENGDGQLTESERGIELVEVQLSGQDVRGQRVELSELTDVQGQFRFEGLVAGDYLVREIQPAQWIDGEETAPIGAVLTENDTFQVRLGPEQSVGELLFAELPIPEPADLQLTVISDAPSILVGTNEVAVVTVRLRNESTVDVPQVVVQGDVSQPGRIGAASVVFDRGQAVVSPDGMTFRWTIEALAPGEVVMLDLEVGGVEDPAMLESDIKVSSRVTSPIDLINANDDADQLTLLANRVATFDVTARRSQSTVVAGGQAPFEMAVTWRNQGPATATGFRGVLNIPDGFELVSVESDRGDAGGRVGVAELELDSLNPGDEAVLVARFVAAADQPEGEVVFFASTEFVESLTDPPSVASSINVTNTADLAVSVDDQVVQIDDGQEGTYRIELEHRGDSVARDVVVVAEVSPLVQLGNLNSVIGQATSLGQVVTWRIGSLDPGERQELSVDYRVDASGVASEFVDVVVEVSSDVTDPNLANNSQRDRNQLAVEPEVGLATGRVWNDLNEDGIQQSNEPGLAEWLVYADLNGNDQLDFNEPSTRTDAAGDYTIDVPPGSFRLQIVEQDDWRDSAAGAGRFSTRAISQVEQPLRATNFGRDVQAADFDGDGVLELVVANEILHRVSLYRDDATEAVTLADSFPVGLRPRSLTPIDFDGDGDLDLAVATVGGPYGVDARDNGLTILRNDGSGSFSFEAAYLTVDGPAKVIAADTNRDGRPDLITVGLRDGRFELLLNRGGRFERALSLPVAATATSVAAADVDSDGHIDFAVTDFARDEVVFISNQAGRLQVTERVTVGDGPSSIVAANFDANRGVEWVVANYLGDDVVTLRHADAMLAIGQRTKLTQGARPSALLVADLDDDGRDDLVVSNQELDIANVIFSQLGELGQTIDLTPGSGQAGAAAVNGRSGERNGRVDLAVLVWDYQSTSDDLEAAIVWLENSVFDREPIEFVAGREAPPVNFGVVRVDSESEAIAAVAAADLDPSEVLGESGLADLARSSARRIDCPRS